MNPKIQAFAHLLGKVSDEQLAEMAGVTVEEARAAREAAVEKPPVETPPEKPPVEEKLTREEKAEVKRLKEQLAKAQADNKALEAENQTLKAQLASAQAEVKPEVKAPTVNVPAEKAPEIKAPEAPKAVRVTQNVRIKGPKGRDWVLNYGDVYSGEQARYLREHASEVIETYPKVAAAK